MTRHVAGGSLAARILLLLGERYPVTVAQVAVALGVREDAVARECRKLAAQGLATLERLGQETYVALSGEGVTYLGLSAKDVERLRARKLPPPPPRADDDPAFG